MERPIIFNDAMSLAVVEGRKTVTRRPLALPEFRKSDTPGYDWTWRGQAPIRSIAQQQRRPGGCWQDVTNARLLSLCPFGVPGDKLWVRECFAVASLSTHGHGPVAPGYTGLHATIDYRATHTHGRPARTHGRPARWTPSIHMPRWASRTVLDVLDVRVGRLQSMTEEDARAEGFESRAAFVETWDAIYPSMPFHANPWVWRIEFRRAT